MTKVLVITIKDYKKERKTLLSPTLEIMVEILGLGPFHIRNYLVFRQTFVPARSNHRSLLNIVVYAVWCMYTCVCVGVCEVTRPF